MRPTRIRCSSCCRPRTRPGKDGTIKHVMSGVNPQGCQVFAFKKPSSEELDHNFLWRYMKALPERGRIGIFNRSYYEDVLVVRVHPELARAQRCPDARPGEKFWQDRYDDINAFERHLTRNGTLVLKFFLNVSKEEQQKRFLERLERAGEELEVLVRRSRGAQALGRSTRTRSSRCCSTRAPKWAPWWVIPADHKWVTRALVAGIITRSIEQLGLTFPEVSDKERKRLEAARVELVGKQVTRPLARPVGAVRPGRKGSHRWLQAGRTMKKTIQACLLLLSVLAAAPGRSPVAAGRGAGSGIAGPEPPARDPLGRSTPHGSRRGPDSSG